MSTVDQRKSDAQWAPTPATADAAVPTDPNTYTWFPGKKRRANAELWKSRELLSFFVWKEFTVRYKQTAIGVLWVVLQPLFFALMFAGVILHKSTVGFGLAQGSNFVPLYLGMCYWLMVSTAVNNGANSLLSSGYLLNKVYIPRQIPVLSTTILAGVDFIFAVSLVPFFALITGTPMKPLGFLISVLAAVPLLIATHGLVLVLAGGVLRFRDLRLVVPYVINLLFFFSSALFPLGLYAAKYRGWILSNPIAALIEWARNSTFGTPSALTATTNRNAIAIGLVMLILGFLTFNRMTKNTVEQL